MCYNENVVGNHNAHFHCYRGHLSDFTITHMLTYKENLTHNTLRTGICDLFRVKDRKERILCHKNTVCARSSAG